MSPRRRAPSLAQALDVVGQAFVLAVILYLAVAATVCVVGTLYGLVRCALALLTGL